MRDVSRKVLEALSGEKALSSNTVAAGFINALDSELKKLETRPLEIRGA